MTGSVLLFVFTFVLPLLLFILSVVDFVSGYRIIGIHWSNFVMGLSNTGWAIGSIIRHDEAMAAFSAAVAAISFWLWWYKGGGDGTKRRLREALKKFFPVRRTAPATS